MAELIVQNRKQQSSDSDSVSQRKSATVLQDNRGQVSQARVLTDNRTAQLEANSSPKPNNTGLPNQLKAGIESLSGMSMDHVKVHYNSDKPAQLNAHAYAQGSDIHVAQGQEKHLPHEAWHVVQQAQGRVRPTVQMKPDVPVNDDRGLENEADVMGARVLQMVAEVQDTRSVPVFSERQNTSPDSLFPNDIVTQCKSKEIAQLHLDTTINTVETAQLMDGEQEAEVSRRKTSDAFRQIDDVLENHDATATVRIAVRAPKDGQKAGVGHSAISITATGGGERRHIQVGMDNKSLVKLEGQTSRENTSTNYTLTIIEKPLNRAAALTLINTLKTEVGKKHTYKEWLAPGAVAVGYENCSTWAEKMARVAGVTFGETHMNTFTRPYELGRRMRDAGKQDGQETTYLPDKDGTLRSLHGRDQNEFVSERAEFSNKWLVIETLIESLEGGAAKSKDSFQDDLMINLTDKQYGEYLAVAKDIFSNHKKKEGSWLPYFAAAGVGVLAIGIGATLHNKR